MNIKTIKTKTETYQTLATRSKHMFVTCSQNTGQNHNRMIANKSIENVTKFNYLGKKVTIKYNSRRN